MILNEHRGEPSSARPTSDEWLLEPGPVWYTPPAKSGHANDVALPARLVRSLGDKAWVALLRREGGWKRLQARNERLAPRREVLEIDHVWAAAQGTNSGAFTSGAREAPDGAVNGTPARVQPAANNPRAGLSIAAEPGLVRARNAALQCPDCGATGGRRGLKFRDFRDLRHHQTMAHRAPDPAAPLECPDCRATSSKRGQKFRDSGHLAQHRKRCARRAAKVAPPAEPIAPEEMKPNPITRRAFALPFIAILTKHPGSPGAASSAGVLTPGFLDALRAGYVMSEADRACHNAVTNNDTNSLALNRAVLRGDDGHFSHRIKSQGITDQKKSGRCWMFAALNVLRPQVMRDHGMADFEFSAAYLQFWDKLEKANLFLEEIIELRDADYLDRDWEKVNKHAMQDGGWWNYVVGLVGKYGVVPASAMPETHASSHTQILNQILGRLLRARAARLLAQYADGAGVEDLRAGKTEALSEVYRLLVINLGEPPTAFEWRYRRVKPGGKDAQDSAADMKNPAADDLTPLEHHTPQSFSRKYLGASLADFVCLYNDPHNELDRHYRFSRQCNIVGNECMHFVNIDTAPMKTIAAAAILANEPVWCAVNMNIDQCGQHGLMEHQLFDYETLFGIDLTLSKADRTRFHAGASCHAMAIMGVDLAADGRPRKWLVENSHGDEVGNKGQWTLHDKWFDEHVYTIIVHQRHVPAAILQRFEEEPTALPVWYPGAGGIRFQNP